jgi:UDP-glucose 4-epimerase
MTTLLVGRGLLGRAVLADLRSRGDVVHTVEVPWGEYRASVDAVTHAAARTAAEDGAWRLVWAAGAGVIATSEGDLETEVATFAGCLAALSVPPSAMFLASSAGGVYAGSTDTPPFTEESAVGAASPYGTAKLAMEAAAVRLAGRGTRVLIGRIANLYGPGQNLAKPQGLVSQLCLSHLTRQPMTIYASMDSLRDYVFAADAAWMAVSGLERIEHAEPGVVVTKILASGVSRSVGSVIGESARAFRRRPLLVVRRAANQVIDLRLRSTTWPDLDAQVDGLTFGAGLHMTTEHIGRQLRAGQLRDAVSPRWT